MLKTLNKKLAPVRVIVEEGHATIRTHGAPPETKPLLMELMEAMKAGEIRVPPGVYRVEMTRTRLVHVEANLRPVD